MAHPKRETLYHRIAAELRQRISQGEFAAENRLGSERMLGQEFGVQRNTIRQALALLETEGQIVKDRRGSFLVHAPASRRNVFLVNVHTGVGSNISMLHDGFAVAAELSGFEVRRISNNPLPNSTVSQVPDLDLITDDIAGVMIWPHFPIDTEKIRRINERVPVVLVDRRIMGLATDCVRFDDVAGGKAVTQHLIDLGHRRIAFLTDEVFAETVQSRWQGYVLAHEEANMPYDPRLSLLYQFLEADVFEPTMRRLFSMPGVGPTSIVCANDVVAFGLLRFLNGEGIRVPEDVSVTGFGDAIPEYTAAVSLTTMYQPFFEVGREAARLLCERAGQPAEMRLMNPTDVALPVRLVPRGSTSHPGVSTAPVH